jgi:predicted nucleotidyltransferase
MTPQNLAEILAELRYLLNDILGSQMVGLYLYGSYARGEARPDSDIDVLVVIKASFDYGELIQLTSQAVAGISLKYDVVVSRAFLSENDFEKSQGIFVRNIRKEIISI